MFLQENSNNIFLNRESIPSQLPEVTETVPTFQFDFISRTTHLSYLYRTNEYTVICAFDYAGPMTVDDLKYDLQK